MMGLVMIFNTTSAEVLDHALSRGTHHALMKQIFYAAAGIVFSFAAMQMGYKKFISISPYLLIIFTILLILTLIPGIGKEVNGSRRWIGFAGMTFQPSEFVKFILPSYLIYRLKPLDPSRLSFKDFAKLIATLFIPIFLILIEPNNGTAGIILLAVTVGCFLSNIPFKYFATPIICIMVIGGISATQLPYVTARLNVYLHPEIDIMGKGHQPYQAKIAAGSGKLTGRGPGNSLQKLSYLPEAQNDYIAAIYAEEFGFIGMTVLITMYAIFGLVGFTIAHFSTTREGCALAGVITFLICFQAFMNLGVVSGLLPSTGLNLPFFSQGGTSLMANLCGLGLLIHIGMENAKEAMVS